MDDKVKDPTDGMTGEVQDKDGKPIDGAKVEVDPTTGGIKVTVPEGTGAQDAKVVVKDKDGKPVGDPIGVTITKPKGDSGEPSKPTDPTGTPAPQEPAIDKGKCAASAVGFGLPLLALIPVGLATQMSIPGVSEFVENVSKDLERANAQIQQNLGMFNPQTAQALSQMNEQLRKAGFDLASLGAGIAVIAAGIIAGTIIYDNCAPGGLGGSSVKLDGSSK